MLQFSLSLCHPSSQLYFVHTLTDTINVQSHSHVKITLSFTQINTAEPRE
uniref:Uncharacterized protein n=1 Tax=Octopus bimaculoides TaxID=37653 RepID=A0A0L8GXG7_OCTBM